MTYSIKIRLYLFNPCHLCAIFNNLKGNYFQNLQ
jgi:hypothetical protein